MKDVTEKNFGVIIAFLLPGFLFLWGLSYSFDEVATWLVKSSTSDAPTIGGFLYATLASLSLGLLISAVRWLLVDHLLHCTGIGGQSMDFSNLKDKDRFAAFQGVVENHYRYYQYYSNTLIAILAAFILYLVFGKAKPSVTIWIVTISIVVALFFGSRDALNKYYTRANEILK